jgi:hypothetical protein
MIYNLVTVDRAGAAAGGEWWRIVWIVDSTEERQTTMFICIIALLS